jgi:lipopolysaccharide transport system ATP-binding protein
MQSDPILTIEKLWRRYRWFKRKPANLKEAFVRLFRRGGLAREEHCALRDVSFSVRRGEIVGFCGANGSGKSTLLRIIAGIDPPTFGRVRVYGTIATLLDLTTGFHPWLTGRENIALGATLMGLTEEEIARKEPSIIEFADLGEYIDSAVSTYSLGMYMRLGFAIAAHVQADLVLIDEVLAVGDFEFQKKCIHWLREWRARNLTVLVVSHDLVSLAMLCDRVIWLHQGQVMADGAPEVVLKQYYPYFVMPSVSEPVAVSIGG